MAQTAIPPANRLARGGSPPAQRAAARQGPPAALLFGALIGLVALGGLVFFFLEAAQGGQAIAELRTSDFHALAVSPADPNVVLFGHHNGVMRSQDGGRTWSALVDRRNFDAMGLAISPADPRRVYLAGHDIFQVSSDGGQSWQPVAHNLPGTDLHGFAVSPDDPSRLYAFVVGAGLGRSTDGGRTWEGLGARLPEDIHALAAAGGNPETLYAGSMQSGVLRSTDGGRMWTQAADLGGRDEQHRDGHDGYSGRRQVMVAALAVDPSARQTVYAGLDDGLYKSADGGATWTKLPFPGNNAVALAISPSSPSVLLAINARDKAGLVYRSQDGGATWTGRS